ncbi:MAG TPA: 2,3-epoxybenzoyl-CoA dihydrolase [Polyangiaceae bacterium]|jgi:benzoyl-CoA-dihydrodiol lyase|nr:2,3-epoxybenzoyl-CoA dihydrolase [Polyangiaceae bacterium]
MEHQAAPARVQFETEPGRYQHWKLSFPETYGGDVAELALDVQEDGGLVPGYPLKLNSYDLGVDIELADALTRIRFEHPKTRAIVVTSAKPRIFSSGANIYMLASSTHAFKVNFCKFTNETRIYLEEMSSESHIPSLAALNATASGGGYELALACDEIVLVDDGSSVVSLPEAPSLGVLPGTGGLTRLSDKRKVRRDLADVFSTLAEGVRGKRAAEWRLIDESAEKSQFDKVIHRRVDAMKKRSPKTGKEKGIAWKPLKAEREASVTRYTHVTLDIDVVHRLARITIEGPGEREPTTVEAIHAAGVDQWALRAFRELDDALLHLRFNYPTVGLLLVETKGDIDRLVSLDRALFANKKDWLVREILLHMRRVLRRIDTSARSVFALAKEGSCFAGSLLEIALAADRLYMLDGDRGPKLALSPLNGGVLPTFAGVSRLQSRFWGEPDRATQLVEAMPILTTSEAVKSGLVTFAPDDIDWDDEIRVVVEERTSLSPDALTGLEQNLRFPGPETMETKIFGRLSAWQNWIFQRPNAVGAGGALTRYGKPERPEFDFGRT